MEYRQLGASGLRVSALSLGTMACGGGGYFAFVGATDAPGAARQLDMVLAAGVNLLDTADLYSDGVAEQILGQALKGRRDRLLVATKARFPIGAGRNDAGLSRQHLIRSVEASRRRMDIDHNLAAASLTLTDEDRRRLHEVSAPPLTCPYSHQRVGASDRLGAADRSLLGSRE